MSPLPRLKPLTEAQLSLTPVHRPVDRQPSLWAAVAEGLLALWRETTTDMVPPLSEPDW